MTKKRGIIAGTSLIIFAVLTWVVAGSVAAGTSDALAFDTVIREWFYSIRSPWLTEVVKAITFMGNTETIVTICVLLLVVPLIIGLIEKLTKKGRGTGTGKTESFGLMFTAKIGLPIAVVAIAGSAINKIFKHTILRPRPDVSLHLIEQGGWSFPSGHSISGLLLYGFMVWLIRRYLKKGTAVNVATVILTMLWIGVGFSRIYLGVHYPTDILGGWTLGMILMLVTIIVVEKLENRKV